MQLMSGRTMAHASSAPRPAFSRAPCRRLRRPPVAWSNGPQPSPTPPPARIAAAGSPEQLRAALSPSSVVVVTAGPGTGKTRVLELRGQYLVHTGAVPAELLVLTFTRSAAAEIKDRLKCAVDGSMEGVTACTIHSFCEAILRGEHGPGGTPAQIRADFRVADEDDSMLAVEKVLLAMPQYRNLSPEQFHNVADAVYNIITRVKSQLRTAAECTSPHVLASVFGWLFKHNAFSKAFDQVPAQCKPALQMPSHIADLLQEYDRALRRVNMLDYNDQLLFAVEALGGNTGLLDRLHGRFKHLLVDEFQDINAPQYELIKLLTGLVGGSIKQGHTLFAVGDAYQAIYTFRGADPQFLETQLQLDYIGAAHCTLYDNYRSSAPIPDVAHSLLSHASLHLKRKPGNPMRSHANAHVTHVTVNPSAVSKEVVGLVQQLMATGKKPGSIVVQAFSQSACRTLSNRLRDAGIRYKPLSSRVSFWETSPVKDMEAHLSLVLPEDTSAGRGYTRTDHLERVLTRPYKEGVFGEAVFRTVASVAQQAGLTPSELVLEGCDKVQLSPSETRKLMQDASQWASQQSSNSSSSSSSSKGYSAHQSQPQMCPVLNNLAPGPLPQVLLLQPSAAAQQRAVAGLQEVRGLSVLLHNAARHFGVTVCMEVARDAGRYLQHAKACRVTPKLKMLFDRATDWSQTAAASGGGLDQVSEFCSYISHQRQLDKQNVDKEELDEDDEHVKVSTKHGMKGRESSIVIIANVKGSQQIKKCKDEDTRLEYVAYTRAKIELYTITDEEFHGSKGHSMMTELNKQGKGHLVNVIDKRGAPTGQTGQAGPAKQSAPRKGRKSTAAGGSSAPASPGHAPSAAAPGGAAQVPNSGATATAPGGGAPKPSQRGRLASKQQSKQRVGRRNAGQRGADV